MFKIRFIKRIYMKLKITNYKTKVDINNFINVCIQTLEAEIKKFGFKIQNSCIERGQHICVNKGGLDCV